MNDFWGNLIILSTILLLCPLFFYKKFQNSTLWSATVTPLASIIGSGFLVSAPLVILTTGRWAPITIAGVVSVGYCLGSALRQNIIYMEPLIEKGSKNWTVYLEKYSRIALGVAYMISAAFYLKLLSIFVLKGLMIQNLMLEKVITTTILISIGGFGWYRGLSILEVFEKYAVSFKIIIILSMIMGHLFFNIKIALEGNFFLAEHMHDPPFQAFRKLLGILIIIQGFETSRYLGEAYSQKIRIKTMKYAQIISGGIYFVFVCSSMILLNEIHTVSESVVIDLCRMVAPLLPFLLVLAAVMSQFSASVSVTIGSSSILSESAHKYINFKKGTVITVLVAVLLTWTTNIYEIIAVVSKAFAIYYGIQCAIAAKVAYNLGSMYRMLLYGCLMILMGLVIILGIPVK